MGGEGGARPPGLPRRRAPAPAARRGGRLPPAGPPSAGEAPRLGCPSPASPHPLRPARAGPLPAVSLRGGGPAQPLVPPPRPRPTHPQRRGAAGRPAPPPAPSRAAPGRRPSGRRVPPAAPCRPRTDRRLSSCDRPGAEGKGEPGVACASPSPSLPPRGCRKPPTTALRPHDRGPKAAPGRGASLRRGGRRRTAAVASGGRAGGRGDLEEVPRPGRSHPLAGANLAAGGGKLTAAVDLRRPRRKVRLEPLPRSAGGLWPVAPGGPVPWRPEPSRGEPYRQPWAQPAPAPSRPRLDASQGRRVEHLWEGRFLTVYV